MEERIAQIQANVDDIRKSGRLPHWRMSYADFLLERAREYVAVDRLNEAQRVAGKLERWVDSHRESNENTGADDSNPMVFWNQDLLERISKNIRKTLSEKRLLVPSTERDSILRRLDLVESWVKNGKFLEAHDELLSLRASLIARLRRSFRARIVATTAYSGTSSTLPAGSLVGPYNSRHTLEETFHIVGERDPIWVEDFLEIYNDLFRIVERLSPVEK
ncbi:MAG: hypothetical protein HUK21_09845 [Fibrobacteraceae bacterium]|nr:hypothetical protein [Fibrobacteraceae bacterium]